MCVSPSYFSSWYHTIPNWANIMKHVCLVCIISHYGLNDWGLIIGNDGVFYFCHRVFTRSKDQPQTQLVLTLLLSGGG